MRSFLIPAALLAAGAAEAHIVSPDYWPNATRNPYQADPVIARRLRCAALMEAISNIYFGAMDHADPRLRGEASAFTSDTPRMPAEDMLERQAYFQATQALYDAAEVLGRAKPKYTHVDFHGWYHDSNQLEALKKVREGIGYAGLNSRVVRCFEYPQIAALQPRIAARLRLPVPARVQPASPRIQPNWMPLRTVGYFYRPDSYRYLACAGLAQAVAKARFGQMPPPDSSEDYSRNKSPDPARATFRKAVRDTFLAGHKTLVANTPVERQAYLMNYYGAERGGDTLVKNGVAADAAREPSLRCAELPTMVPIVPLLG
ncbi:hypothetical protein P6144_11210 [Sphingomonas sp. HITSZ_GF]|uniref:hypothetical protein n=1 Tax=Sphingomonas sp. HITSZ_GF TaxID=3037247 RepID=UPI00240E7334|nr:hypothetical protein [Sphingomonas sp. HITSZ_GF]MDG2534220.1 hypothetical protein [Sphingomonas sp. HITSZ_GF]